MESVCSAVDCSYTVAVRITRKGKGELEMEFLLI